MESPSCVIGLHTDKLAGKISLMCTLLPFPQENDIHGEPTQGTYTKNLHREPTQGTYKRTYTGNLHREPTQGNFKDLSVKIFKRLQKTK